MRSSSEGFRGRLCVRRPICIISGLINIYKTCTFWQRKCILSQLNCSQTVSIWYISNLIIFCLFRRNGQGKRKICIISYTFALAVRTFSFLLNLNQVIADWILKINEFQLAEAQMQLFEETLNELNIEKSTA